MNRDEAVAEVLAGVIDGAWVTDSEHDPGCFGGGHYCETHCPVPVQRPVDIAEIVAVLAHLAARDRVVAATAAETALRPIRALASEWDEDLDSGRIRDKDARYCWGTALRELDAALADALAAAAHPDEESKP